MNLIWNKNIFEFKKRFPSLAEIYAKQIEEISKYFETENTENPFSFWQVQEAKDGNFTAIENSVRLHSSYNPVREAKTILDSSPQSGENSETQAAFFYGFGLGYHLVEFAKSNPKGALFAIEKDPLHFFAALSLIDWTEVFHINLCVIALECPPESVLQILESQCEEKKISMSSIKFFFNLAFVKHDEKYFLDVRNFIQQAKNKNQINENTRKRFAKLWERNARINLQYAEKLDGISIYKNKFMEDSRPFLLIAAGPSLQKMLPKLSELKNKMITVCVDTALRAVLKVGVEPDFIILTDPQFWAYLHIAGLKSPSSVLICDSVTYPAAFRFKCKKIVMSSSPLPISEKYKQIYDKKGTLSSGGSVATVAWNFCEMAGAKEIFTCGLDLSFPKNQTHIKGSTFEQAMHTSSGKIKSAEKSTCDVIFGADVSIAKDYNGNDVITDTRMKMFAWWFTRRIQSCPHVKTYTLCPESMKVEGIELNIRYEV